MRIISGKFGGLSLQGAKVERAGYRPTTDRVKESIFSILESKGKIEGLEVLDLFSGSGGLGFEALSRGAARVTFVEHDKVLARMLHANAERLGVIEFVKINTQTVTAWHRQFPTKVLSYSAFVGFDLVLLDPPYEHFEDGLELLNLLASSGYLACSAVCVFEVAKEHSSKVESFIAEAAVDTGLRVISVRNYGTSSVVICEKLNGNLSSV